jgi:hypothetical protein
MPTPLRRSTLGLLVLLLVGGCGGPSEDIPLADVRKEAVTLSDEALRERVEDYRDAWLTRQRQMDNIRAKIKASRGRRPARLEALAERATDISRSMERLQKRYDIYFEALTRRGLDVDDLKLDPG